MQDTVLSSAALPIAILSREALDANRRFLRELIGNSGASFCPHAKTTMSPELVAEQIEDGVWGLTAANAEQAQRLWSWGVKRILIANQVVDNGGLSILSDLLNDVSLELFVLVDSVATCELLSRHVANKRPVSVLLEVGGTGGRTGVRTLDEAVRLATFITAQQSLVLRGVEAFENVFGGDQERVEEILSLLAQVARTLADAGLFGRGEVILSAGGSTHYDRAIRWLRDVQLQRATRVVVRAGCIVAHDQGMVARAYERILDRDPLVRSLPRRPVAALEVWAAVQSRPEAELAILGAGKRDMSFDVDLPVPLKWMRSGQVTSFSSEHRVLRLNDQHAMVHVPKHSPLQVGDLVCLGISHPCTTFDRWRTIPVVDSGYRQVGIVSTFFRPQDTA
jgi:D-serine dehydratase